MKCFHTLRNLFWLPPGGCFLLVIAIFLLFPPLEASSNTKTSAKSVVQDWLVSPDPLAMPIFPPHGVTVKQNPPIFRWPYSADAVGYVLRLTDPTGKVREITTKNNWVFLSALLMPGDYQWEVHKSGSSVWSQPRIFTVDEITHPFLLPDPLTLLEKASRSPRPRALPKGQEEKQLIAELFTGSRKQGFSQLQREVEKLFQSNVSPDVLLSLDTKGKFEVREPARKTMHQALKSGYVWWATGNLRQLHEAKSRALILARLDPQKGTGIKNADLISQEIALTLARLYDLLHPKLSDEEKNQLKSAITIRTQDLYKFSMIDRQHGLKDHPFSSHGIRHIGAIATIATLMAGDIDEAKSWFMNTFPVYAAIIPPWGGEDGGYANGTNYAVWDILTFIEHWDILKQTIGVDFTKTSWAQEFGNFLAYFLPQGTPRGVFGDGEEYSRPQIWGALAAVYAQRVRTKISQHYSQQWNHAPWDRLGFLFGPLSPLDEASKSTRFSEVLSHSTIISSTGWAALHSNLDDPNRTSIYFKSSPYGSYNHSHADQNSFVIYSKGHPLAIASGYYDYYWSPHHKNWTIQTQAHNAITFDGGEGQQSRSRAAKGQIVRFEEKGEYDYVIGDASQAYNGIITKAIRTLMYIRPDSLLVYDRLESELPHQWEWNIHSVIQFNENQKNGTIRLDNGPTSLCIKSLARDPLTFHQNDKFPVNPTDRPAPHPKQWHGTYKTTHATKKHEFLFHLSVDCGNANIGDVKALSKGGYSFHIENQPGEISDSYASFLNKDTTPPSIPRNIQIR